MENAYRHSLLHAIKYFFFLIQKLKYKNQVVQLDLEINTHSYIQQAVWCGSVDVGSRDFPSAVRVAGYKSS